MEKHEFVACPCGDPHCYVSANHVCAMDECGKLEADPIHQTGERVQEAPLSEERGHDGLTDDERMKQMTAPLPETCAWCGQRRGLEQENRQLREQLAAIRSLTPPEQPQ